MAFGVGFGLVMFVGEDGYALSFAGLQWRVGDAELSTEVGFTWALLDNQLSSTWHTLGKSIKNQTLQVACG